MQVDFMYYSDSILIGDVYRELISQIIKDWYNDL